MANRANADTPEEAYETYEDLSYVDRKPTSIDPQGQQKQPARSSVLTERAPFTGIFLLTILALFIVFPLGFVALILAVIAEGRAYSTSSSKHESSRRLRTASFWLSIAAVIIGVIIVVVCVGVIYGASKDKCKPDNSTSTTGYYINNICYAYRLQVTSDACNYGYYSDGYCYYDRRYNGGRTCVGLGADHSDDNYCYHSSSDACPYARNYANNFCYQFVMQSSRPECRYGYYGSGKCYYSTRYYYGSQSCRSSEGADHYNDSACYYSSPEVCSYSTNFANNFCYPYVVWSTPDHCLHGHFANGFCYYDSRQTSYYCNQYYGNSGDQFPDGFCYRSSSAVCPYTRKYANNYCYNHIVPLASTACIHGYQANGYCYYITRYVNTSSNCIAGRMDLASDGYCYFISSSDQCRYTKRYANNYCYPYIFNSTSKECGFGYYSAGYCYYDSYYSYSATYYDRRDCRSSYCYYTTSSRCRFAANYINNICHNYRATTSSCSHGRRGSNGNCYYTGRSSSSTCSNGDRLTIGSSTYCYSV